LSQKLEILSERKNLLLKRIEYEINMDHGPSGTPIRTEIRKKIAAKLTQKLEKVFVEKVITLAGQNQTKVIVHVYDDEKIVLKIEPKYIIKRNEIKEEKKEISEKPEDKKPEVAKKEKTQVETKKKEEK
jgi:ribosomal protein S24E